MIVPESRRLEVLRMLECDDNLADLSISRPVDRVQWGIRTPHDPNHLIYVWLDALSVYLTAADYGTGHLSASCPPTLQVIGKDILKYGYLLFT